MDEIGYESEEMREDGAREQMRVMGPGWGGFRWVPRFEGREGQAARQT